MSHNSSVKVGSLLRSVAVAVVSSGAPSLLVPLGSLSIFIFSVFMPRLLGFRSILVDSLNMGHICGPCMTVHAAGALCCWAAGRAVRFCWSTRKVTSHGQALQDMRIDCIIQHFVSSEIFGPLTLIIKHWDCLKIFDHRSLLLLSPAQAVWAKPTDPHPSWVASSTAGTWVHFEDSWVHLCR